MSTAAAAIAADRRRDAARGRSPGHDPRRRAGRDEDDLPKEYPRGRLKRLDSLRGVSKWNVYNAAKCMRAMKAGTPGTSTAKVSPDMQAKRNWVNARIQSTAQPASPTGAMTSLEDTSAYHSTMLKQERSAEMQRFVKWWVIDPRISRWLSAWDIGCIFALVFVALVTPFEIAFLDSPRSGADIIIRINTVGWLFIVNRLVDAMFTVCDRTACAALAPLPCAAARLSRLSPVTVPCRCLLSPSLDTISRHHRRSPT